MSNTNDTSRLATFEDHDTLADTELDAVTGGDLRGSNPDDRKGGRYLAMS